VDVKYKFEIGDMVEFTLTAYGSPKAYHGVISERYGGVDHYSGKMSVYKICCLEKRMIEFTISEILIIGKV